MYLLFELDIVIYHLEGKRGEKKHKVFSNLLSSINRVYTSRGGSSIVIIVLALQLILTNQNLHEKKLHTCTWELGLRRGRGK